jgi:hypothetical protein
MNIVMLDKAMLGLGWGWDHRQISVPKTILIHTTNGAKGSLYKNEVKYIYQSRRISSHYLVGKEGQITQFLDVKERAWHAGAVNDSSFNNNNSIGIENHYTPGEGPWTPAMHIALTDLVKYLMQKCNITSPELIETHRKVAIPKGRKIDPSGFSDEEFYLWRSQLIEKPKPKPIIYKVVVDVARIRTSPKIASNNIVPIRLNRNDIFESEARKIDENMEYTNGINTWAHITRGFHNGKPIDGLGFVHTSVLTIVG